MHHLTIESHTALVVAAVLSFCPFLFSVVSLSLVCKLGLASDKLIDQIDAQSAIGNLAVLLEKNWELEMLRGLDFSGRDKVLNSFCFSVVPSSL